MSSSATKSSYFPKSARSAGQEWTPQLIQQAERSAGSGNIKNAAQLCSDLLADDRVSGCLREVRIRGLLGLPLTFQPAVDSTDDTALIEAASEDWWHMVPEDSTTEWMEWGILLGIGVGHITCWERVEQPSGTRLLPHRHDGRIGFDVVHPSSLKFDKEKQAWTAQQEEGDDVVVTPGDSHWLVYTPYGSQRPWERGAWRSIARWWMLKQFAQTDWGRYSELHGQGILAADTTENILDEDRNALAKELMNLGRESKIVLPPGANIRLIESTANTWATFEAQIKCACAAIAIRILGQNLSTEVQSGSYAAAQVHQSVGASIIRADDETSATTLRQQLLFWWTEYNYGSSTKAPWPKRDTAPKEDSAALAKVLIDGATAAKQWHDLGAPIDFDALARTLKLPLLADGQWTEPRARQELPDDGFGFDRKRYPHEVDIRLASGANPSTQQGLIRGKKYADEMADSAQDLASASMIPSVDSLMNLVERVDDGPNWQRRMKTAIVKSYGAMPQSMLTEVLHRAIVLAELAGQSGVKDDATGA